MFQTIALLVTKKNPGVSFFSAGILQSFSVDED
jgi:hypothetical protein